MSEVSTRLKCLELARPDNPLPDIGLWLDRAKQLESYATGVGQAEKPQQEPVMNGSPKPGQPASRGPAAQRR